MRGIVLSAVVLIASLSQGHAQKKWEISIPLSLYDKCVRVLGPDEQAAGVSFPPHQMQLGSKRDA
jgi:hypothetical protein